MAHHTMHHDFLRLHVAAATVWCCGSSYGIDMAIGLNTAVVAPRLSSSAWLLSWSICLHMTSH